MELLEFQNNLSRKWQKKIYSSCWVSFLIILIVELIIFICYLGFGFIHVEDAFSYFMIRIFIPSGLNFTVLCITKKFIQSEKCSVEQKNYIVCINILVICIVTAAVHNYYFIDWNNQLTPQSFYLLESLFHFLGDWQRNI